MSIRRVDLANAKHMPWKNGAGSTAELAIAPPGASLDDFAWRISSAKVAGHGSFSSFSGLDRSLAILSGAGLRLHSEASAPLELTTDSQPWAFQGETTVYAELIDGEVTDFNLISRRADWTHDLQSLNISTSHRLAAAEQTTVLMIYCHAGGPLTCQFKGEQQLLSAGQGLLLDEADAKHAITLSTQIPSKVYLAHLQQRASH
ncbi:HutD family protein [Pseudomonas sp.]|uniref:HutD/Ves family protein n=1 Tax=Pseudomonas sp. TaxID=306 RepID=UPI003A97B669